MAISNKFVMVILAPFAAILAKLAVAINGFDGGDRQNGQTSMGDRSHGATSSHNAVIASEAKQSRAVYAKSRLLRFARNDDPWVTT
ncbi:MAG TPA: hypothetical protein VGN68_04920 [Sphingopyxis sp.]|jgi:hypothetical protein|uniref:hypothetical protein n=1 Tax=Sphingopyxis sp. TaxID=1908224 RepID=UPI002E0D14BD|nr:hypothetical protein [Sphingopyxis sp.]